MSEVFCKGCFYSPNGRICTRGYNGKISDVYVRMTQPDSTCPYGKRREGDAISDGSAGKDA